MHGMHDRFDYELGAFENWCDYGRTDPYCEDPYDYYFYPGMEDDDFCWDKEYIDQYCPSQGGCTQPKIWWTYSRKDGGLDTEKLRRRRRDHEIRVSNISNHGRDMAECWEARDRGRRRKLSRAEGEHFYEFLYRANKLRRRYQRANQRKARKTIRKMKILDFYPEYGPENFLEDHMDF